MLNMACQANVHIIQNTFNSIKPARKQKFISNYIKIQIKCKTVAALKTKRRVSLYTERRGPEGVFLAFN